MKTELTRYAEAIADAGPLSTILQAVKVRTASLNYRGITESDQQIRARIRSASRAASALIRTPTFRGPWLRGLDLNQRPLGYEPFYFRPGKGDSIARLAEALTFRPFLA